MKEGIRMEDLEYTTTFCSRCPLYISGKSRCAKGVDEKKVLWLQMNDLEEMKEMTLKTASQFKQSYRCVEWVKHV
ncbi:MAG: hypothetical protein WC495_04990 [Patescibacteria group bacterium]